MDPLPFSGEWGETLLCWIPWKELTSITGHRHSGSCWRDSGIEYRKDYANRFIVSFLSLPGVTLGWYCSVNLDPFLTCRFLYRLAVRPLINYELDGMSLKQPREMFKL
jgi:hypothetical protein